VSRISELVERVRTGIDRVTPADLDGEIAAGAVVIDIRPEQDRVADGALPGAIVIERNVLEWRLDPTSPDRIPEATGDDRRFILVCNEGYASSLAADALHTIGLGRATDLVGGYRAWRALASPSPE
jgi:rhodanese-related sulfurtransferase